MDETILAKTKDPVDKTRDLVAERSATLTLKTAKKLFELPYEQRGKLDDFDSETLQEIFNLALAEAGEQKGVPLWGSAFNSYAALQELIEAVRKPGPFKEGTGGQYAQEVYASRSPLGTTFALLRKHKDMTDDEARQILEISHSSALAGVSSDGRQAVYDYCADRGVSKLEVGNQYSNIADVISKVKRLAYKEN